MFFIQDYIRCEFLDSLMVFFSSLGDYAIPWLISGFILIINKNTRKAGILAILCLGITALITNEVLKDIIRRPRPFVSHIGLKTVVPIMKTYSFPSAHSSTSFASAAALSLSGVKKWRYSYILAALIAVSRVYVGVHYPTDIIFGAILGVFIAFLTYWVFDRFQEIRKCK